jgi:hypothetical protein
VFCARAGQRAGEAAVWRTAAAREGQWAESGRNQHTGPTPAHLIPEGSASAQHDVDRHTQGPHVTVRAVALLAQHLHGRACV